MRQEGAIRRRDAAIAGIAARQHGVLSSQQLYAAGIDPSGIKRRVQLGRLHRLHRGVYAVGHPALSNKGRMAAVLACGEGGVLSHCSAAALWEILPRGGRDTDERAPVDVTVPSASGRRGRRGIRLHRSRTLSTADVTVRSRIPVTKPARTLEDLRRVLPSKQFAAVLRQAEFLRLPLGDRIAPDHTRSELEARFLALCRRHRLPRPEVNARVDRFLVDFLWRERRLIVELDGGESHRSRSAFEEDRARDARLKLLGYDVVRFTWRQLQSEPRQIACGIRALLGRGRLC